MNHFRESYSPPPTTPLQVCRLNAPGRGCFLTVQPNRGQNSNGGRFHGLIEGVNLVSSRRARLSFLIMFRYKRPAGLTTASPVIVRRESSVFLLFRFFSTVNIVMTRLAKDDALFEFGGSFFFPPSPDVARHSSLHRFVGVM